MKIAVVFCFLLAVELGFAQEAPPELCGAKLGTLATCMKDLHDAKEASRPDIDVEQLKVDLLDCFNSSGCQTPASKYDGEEGGPSTEMAEYVIAKLERFGFSFEGLTDENLEQFLDAGVSCGTQLKDELKPKIVTCIQNKDPSFADFEWPEVFDKVDENEDGESGDKKGAFFMMKFFKGHGHHGMKGGKGRCDYKFLWKIGHELVPKVYDEEVCPKESRADVQACIEGLVEAATPEEYKCKTPVAMMFLKTEKHDLFCEGRDLCLAGLGNNCAEAKDNLHLYLCQCTSEEMSSSFNELLDSMKQCMQNESGVTINEPEGKKFRKRLQRFASSYMRGMCSRHRYKKKYDPCNPEKDDDDWEHHGKGWGHGGKGKGGWGKHGDWDGQELKGMRDRFFGGKGKGKGGHD